MLLGIIQRLPWPRWVDYNNWRGRPIQQLWWNNSWIGKHSHFCIG